MTSYYVILGLAATCFLAAIGNEMYKYYEDERMPWPVLWTWIPIVTLTLFVVPFGIFALCLTGIYSLLGVLS